ncbi:MAG: glycosyltransferase, partial [Deltaproteobacteria bacterium]
VVPGVDIVRIECGPPGYIMKVDLWPYLDEFVANCKRYIDRTGRRPDILHSNYADSGLVCLRLSEQLGIPQVHTGHSLGKPKMARLGITNGDFAEADRIYHFSQRLAAEQEVISKAAALVVSTEEERLCQYSMYHVDINDLRFRVVTPGVNLERFYPPGTNGLTEWDLSARHRLLDLFRQELREPERPMLFTISRLDYRKNLISLVKAFAFDEELQKMANLVMVTGRRGKMGHNEQILMDEMEEIIATYGLADWVCIVRHLDYKAEGGEIYRIVHESGGVLVNPALHEPFGITIIEAAASGVPVVATNNGGPEEILGACRCGLLIDPRDTQVIAESCKRILSDPKLWRQFSESGARAARKLYSWESAAKKELRIFQEIIAAP